MKRATKARTWPAPVKGLIRNSALLRSDPSGAEVLTNFIPTAQGARVRGGSREFADVPDPVVQLMTYRSGAAEGMFAATETDVYDITSGGAGVLGLSGQTSGDWSYVQFATTGGQFLYMVNGADDAQHWDGSSWASPSITGVSSDALSFVWAHKRRLWFVEKDTLSAWYLPVDSIAGSANEFPLNGVFRLGGSLMFGGTWSLDSGDGLDDVAIFVTTEGEIAVYQGTDPSSSADWQLSGVYRMGKPIGKNAWFRAGGDLAVVTEDGIVAVSEALQKDRAALQVAAITYPIEDLWQSAVANRSVEYSFPVAVWPAKTIMLIGTPSRDGLPAALVANTRTGAWASITGWDIKAIALFDNRLFFGTADGTIMEADVGGKDVEAPYSARYVPKFQDMGSPSQKLALHARALWRSDRTIALSLSCFADYVVDQMTTPEPSEFTSPSTWGGGGTWGGGVTWGGRIANVTGNAWQAVSASGFALAPAMAITIGGNDAPIFEIAALTLVYEEGNAF